MWGSLAVGAWGRQHLLVRFQPLGCFGEKRGTVAMGWLRSVWVGRKAAPGRPLPVSEPSPQDPPEARAAVGGCERGAGVRGTLRRQSSARWGVPHAPGWAGRRTGSWGAARTSAPAAAPRAPAGVSGSCPHSRSPGCSPRLQAQAGSGQHPSGQPSPGPRLTIALTHPLTQQIRKLRPQEPQSHTRGEEDEAGLQA